jgi:drug/metabolite transporter (DMT)-like permease
LKTVLDLPAVLALVVLCGSWGLNQVAIKVALYGIPPVLQMGGRSLVAAIVVLLWCALRRKPLFGRDGTLWPGLAAGLLFAAEFAILFWGIQFTTASRAAVILYLAPFVVAIGGHFLLGEPLGVRKLIGLALAFGGVLLAFSDALRPVSEPSRGTLVGDMMCLVAAILWGLTTVLIKGSALSRAPAEKTLLYQLGMSAVVGLALSAALGEELVLGRTVAVLPAFLYQAIWVAGLTYVAWSAMVRTHPASLLSSFTFLTPLFGVAFGWALLNEPLSPYLLAALLLVAGGIYLVNRAPAPSQAVPA